MTVQIKVSPIEELMEEHQSVLKLMGEVSPILGLADPSNLQSWAAKMDEACDYFRKEVAIHFKKEEVALFPAMELYLGPQGGPLVVMLREHQEHYQLLDKLCAAVANRDLNAVRSVWETFNPRLTMHIMKEDTVLFPMAERMFSPDERNAISQKMESVSGKA